MEGHSVIQIMNSLKQKGYTVTKIIYDKDFSTLKNVIDVYQNVG